MNHMRDWHDKRAYRRPLVWRIVRWLLAKPPRTR